MILPETGISVGITVLQVVDNKSNGGEGGIRTPDTLSGMPVFKTGAINRSATSPGTAVLLRCVKPAPGRDQLGQDRPPEA